MDEAKKLIGICGVRIYEQNVMPFIKVLKREGEKKGYKIISFAGSTDSKENTEEVIGQYQLVELIRSLELCALVILTETIKNENLIQKLVELGIEKNIPVFSLDRSVAECYNLIMDNRSCFEQIVRHVVEEHGCRWVNMIAGDKGNPFSEERIDIYKKVLEENDIPFEEERVGYGNFWEAPVAAVMKQFFESDLPFPEAIVCANDVMAHAAISILNEHGYEVPEDVIVTGYDGTKGGTIFLPSLTTGCPDYKEMVKHIFSEINTYFNNKTTCSRDIVVPVILKKRQSCGCEQKIMPKKDRRISQLLEEIGNGTWHMKSMHLMLSETFGKQKIEDIFPIISKHMDVWFNFYRYVCVKSDILHTYEVPEKYTQMTSILEGNRGNYKETGEKWNISEFQAYVQRVLNEEKVNTLLVHLLISGKDVYGLCVEGFEEPVDWQIKQCDEFAMFLSHILHTVIHNFKMDKLNENLYKVNKEVQKMSLQDSMTGIYNRRGFFHAIWKIIQNKDNIGKHLFLFMVDMDGLKYINDNFGHAEGDFAIITMAKVLAEMTTGEAVCARVGGDEFICAYVEESAGHHNSEQFSERMESLLKANEAASHKIYSITASVGMISEEITESIDLDALINNADDNMYKKKVMRKKQKKDFL